MITNPTIEPDIEQRQLRMARASGKSVGTVLREALDAMGTGAPILPPAPPRRVTPEEVRAAIDVAVARLGALPILDPRSPDEILGYDEFGLPT